MTTRPELQQILDAIHARQRFVISSHARPDGDAIGSELAMAFALSNPRVSTILTGATRPEQIDQNLRALDVLEGLGEEDLAALKAVGAPGGT